MNIINLIKRIIMPCGKKSPKKGKKPLKGKKRKSSKKKK